MLVGEGLSFVEARTPATFTSKNVCIMSAEMLSEIGTCP